jgi:predicted Zn-dependent protease
MYGYMLLPFIGRAKEGGAMVDRAFRLNPHHPDWYNLVADAACTTGQYTRAVAMLRGFAGDLPVWSIWLLAISDAQLGQQKDAAVAVAELSQHYSDFSMERAFSDFGSIRDQPTLAHYLDGARKAGLRERATPEESQRYPKMIHLALCDAKRATN